MKWSIILFVREPTQTFGCFAPPNMFKALGTHSWYMPGKQSWWSSWWINGEVNCEQSKGSKMHVGLQKWLYGKKHNHATKYLKMMTFGKNSCFISVQSYLHYPGFFHWMIWIWLIFYHIPLAWSQTILKMRFYCHLLDDQL